MMNPGIFAPYVGFTENEVKALCQRYHMDFLETERWYDGYQFRRAAHVYSPKSVVDAMLREEFDSYWSQTETYEALKIYIDMNFDNLKDTIVLMLGGLRCKINPRTFQNDMTTFQSKDDVLTLLVHLGYLAYDIESKEVFIPNQEVAYFSARTYYIFIREMPTGRGFADIVFLPRKNHLQKPAIIAELKWDKTAECAIAQIKRQQYVKSIQDFAGKILLVGINYDKKERTSMCHRRGFPDHLK